jgi:hypothetical protein
MPEIVNINELNPDTFEFQDYTSKDVILINNEEGDKTFNSFTNYVEYCVYDINGVLLEYIPIHNNYTLINNKINLNPETDLINLGFDEGNYNTVYNFLENKISTSHTEKYYIEEISSDRTEVRLNTTNFSSDSIINNTNRFIDERNLSTTFYPDFYLNFGSNQLIISNNILLDLNSSTPTILVKLYEPLSLNFNIKDELWIVDKIAESKAYNISKFETFEIEEQNINLQGPNTNLDIKDQINNSTNYKDLNSLSSTTSILGSGSLKYQIDNLLAQKGTNINVDYTDYTNFVHFSSALTRLENFYYKISLIEQYTNSSSFSDTTTDNYYVSSSKVIWQNKINDLITNFDGYEYYLYYESGSKAWPKTNTSPPYINSTTGSVAGVSFLTSQSITASSYDDDNDNALINTIPSYIREDTDNANYELFLEMIGQHFDNIWIYLKDITNKFNADNRLNYGVSKDLISDILRDLGIKIYQNNFSSDDLYTALIGITPSGSLFNLPYTTTQLPVPANTFLEYIDTYVTASATGSLIPTEDINFETYKRIYANLPLLLKKKGSTQGLRNLITTFGIPDTILRVNEFGGQDKNTNKLFFLYKWFFIYKFILCIEF